MRLRILIFLFGFVMAVASDGARVELDARVLASIPARRHAVLLKLAITGRDSSPEIGEKKKQYVAAMKALIRELRAAYYWHSEFPTDLEVTMEKRAVYLAGLLYPASPTTGASRYGDIVQSYTVRLYEEEVVTIAYAVTERFGEADVVIVRGEAQPFASWKKAWDDAGDVKNGPNQLPEPIADLCAAMAHR